MMTEVNAMAADGPERGGVAAADGGVRTLGRLAGQLL